MPPRENLAHSSDEKPQEAPKPRRAPRAIPRPEGVGDLSEIKIISPEEAKAHKESKSIDEERLRKVVFSGKALEQPSEEQELFARLADIKPEDLPPQIRKARGEFFLGGSSARGSSTAERLMTGYRRLKTKKPERAQELMELLSAFEFQPHDMSPETVSRISKKMRETSEPEDEAVELTDEDIEVVGRHDPAPAYEQEKAATPERAQYADVVNIKRNKNTELESDLQKVEEVRGKMKPPQKITGAEAYRKRLQNKLHELTENEGGIQERINDIQSKYSGFRNWLSERIPKLKNETLKNYEDRLITIRAKRKDLLAKLNEPVSKEKESGRRRMQLIVDRQKEAEAEEERRTSLKEEEPVEPISAIKTRSRAIDQKTISLSPDEFTDVEEFEKGLTPEIPIDTSELAAKNEKEPAQMTIKRAQDVLKGTVAHDLWDLVYSKIKGKPELGVAIGGYGVRDHEAKDPSTAYVFAVAKYVETLQAHDDKKAAKAKADLDTMNKLLKIGDNELVQKALTGNAQTVEIVEPVNTTNVLRGTKARQSRTATMNKRWRT